MCNVGHRVWKCQFYDISPPHKSFYGTITNTQLFFCRIYAPKQDLFLIMSININSLHTFPISMIFSRK